MELSWKYQYTFCESLQLLYPHPQAFRIVGILQLEKCQMVLSQLRPWSRSPLTSGSTLVPNSVPASTWIFPHFICHTAARVMFVTFESDYPTLLLKSSNPYFPLSLSANWVTYFVCVCVYISLILYVLGIPHLLYFPPVLDANSILTEISFCAGIRLGEVSDPVHFPLQFLLLRPLLPPLASPL